MTFIKNEEVDYIRESKLFCKQAGMDPKEIPYPQVVMTQQELEERIKEYEEILAVVHFFGRKILNSMKGTPLLLSVSDEKGFILDMMGDETIKSTINQLGIRPGMQFTEQIMGTNVVNLSLKYSGQPIQLIGTDHYHEYLHQSACYAVAFHYTDIGNLLGSIIIMTSVQFQNPLINTMLSITVDSIERELLLQKQNRKLDIMNQIMMDNTSNGIIVTDKDGTITEFNHSASILTNISKEYAVGRSVLCFETMGRYISNVIRYGRKYENIQLIFEQKNEEDKLVCLFDAFPIYDEHKKLSGAFGQFRNITKRYEAEERYNYLANHDDLTGLPNRRYYKNKLTTLLDEANRGFYPSSIAVMYLDLDRFKLVNDTLGHSNGDLLLKQIADRLKDCIDSNELIARMGGDEFMFLLPTIKDGKQVIKRVEQILSLFRKPFNMNGYEFHITASIGIALYPYDGLDFDTLMIRADTAMYRAKSLGKNQYAIYSSEMHTKSREKIVMETSLRKALENGEFTLYYQPQINIKSGEIKGLEALLRWNHPERGVVSPHEFIPLAEETGLITQLDQWVLRTACQQNKAWQEKGLPAMRVAVNLSSQQFAKEHLVEIVKEILTETRLDPKYLELEITETMTMNVEHTIPTLNKLHALGVQISIDDFGTGYSSLNYLKRFSIHRLKIDRTFVRDIMIDSSDSNIVGTIIAMAHNLGLEVTAEGVEEKNQLRFLQYQNCDEVQGYYFSKPIPGKDIEAGFWELQEIVKKKY